MRIVSFVAVSTLVALAVATWIVARSVASEVEATNRSVLRVRRLRQAIDTLQVQAGAIRAAGQHTADSVGQAGGR